MDREQKVKIIQDLDKKFYLILNSLFAKSIPRLYS